MRIIISKRLYFYIDDCKIKNDITNLSILRGEKFVKDNYFNFS